MNFRSAAFSVIFLVLCTPILAQSIIVSADINLPQDSIVRKQLISSLNSFLIQKEKANKENAFILKDALLETAMLTDEMRGMEKNIKLKDDNFYKCYLTNTVELTDDSYLVQLSYMSVVDKSPVLRAGFKLMAKQVGTQFYFYSPLKQNTRTWQSRKMNNINYYFKDALDVAEAKAYLNMVTFYDKKLNAPVLPIACYYCDNFQEAQEVLGLEYKADYNGLRYDNLSSHENNMFLNVNGWNSAGHRFDPHDLWHERLHAVLSTDSINRPVDEGCAYLYGDSWGFTWPEIQAKFKKYVEDNPRADWLSLYISGENFVPGPKIMKISYMLNALIVQKIERERGFTAVMKLLGCGKKQTGDENFFNALQAICGINKGNFNDSIQTLIKLQ